MENVNTMKILGCLMKNMSLNFLTKDLFSAPENFVPKMISYQGMTWTRT